jgi:UDP-2,4-diacetamido-2,4,6-trideoxy-beta-L-altropyranose hydrolase
MNDIYFRVDASAQIGEGHLRRCLTLAQSITTNCKITFCCVYLTSTTRSLIINAGFKIIQLSENDFKQKEAIITIINQSTSPAILIVDNYYIDAVWERQVKSATKTNLIVIDDLADRPHHCDILIDANYFRKITEYKALVNKECEILCGVEFMILSPQVRLIANNIKQKIITKKKDQSHVFFGATDPHASTAEIALLIAKKYQQYVIAAITENTLAVNTQLAEIQDQNNILVSNIDSDFLINMSECEFAIGAPGITLWERLLLGCKVGCFATHKNQIEILQQLHQENVCCYLGPIWEMTNGECDQALADFYSHKAKLLNIKNIKEYFPNTEYQTIQKKVTGFYPHLQTMKSSNISLESYQSAHIEKTVSWLSDKSLQSSFGFSKEISIQSHTLWLQQQENFYLWAIKVSGVHIGNISVRLNILNNSAYFEIYLGDKQSQGQGTGSTSIELIIKWAFITMNLKSIQLITIKGNKIAENLYKKFGFVLEEIKKNSQMINGESITHHKWQLLNTHMTGEL